MIPLGYLTAIIKKYMLRYGIIVIALLQELGFYQKRVNIFIINSKNFLIRKCKNEKFSYMPLSHSIQYRL